MQIDVKTSIDAAIRDLGVAEKQATWAAVVAINRTLPMMREAIVKQMQGSFDRPTPYTLNSLYSKQATRQNLSGRVAVKDEAASGKGVPATRYLTPEIEGGDRGLKRFEKALRAAGILLPGMFAVPAAGARLDAFGNMERGQVVQIVSYFKAFGEQGYRANMTDKRRAGLAKDNAKKATRGVVYFALPRGRGKLKPGIYVRQSTFGYIKPVMIFVDGAPNYERKLDFYGVGGKVAREQFEPNYEIALAEALATAGFKGSWSSPKPQARR